MTPISWQLAVDATDPHALADFWVEALPYELEDNTAMIDALIAAGQAPAELTLVRPDGIRSWREFEAIRGDDRRILFHAVPEPKDHKNRWHIDLNVGLDQMTAEVERVMALGATLVRETKEPGGHFFVLQDLEGNEFCIQ